MNGSNWGFRRGVIALFNEACGKRHPNMELVEALGEFLSDRGNQRLSERTVGILRGLPLTPHWYAHFYVRRWDEPDQRFGSALVIPDQGDWLNSVHKMPDDQVGTLNVYIARAMEGFC